ncbi:MAG: AAA family ATPase, partial [Pseudomonadota bacterium]|nr:AAA family ATPase [Pseudomonadota bacterium]
MIEIIGGEEGTNELEAARELAAVIDSEWGVLADRIQGVIVAGMQCFGQRTQDIDLVLLIQASEPIELDPLLDFQGSRGESFEPRRLLVHGLCLAIEVKDHPPDDVHFNGNQASVLYRGRPHNATVQSENQQVSLRNYLTGRRVKPPFVVNLLWFRGIRQNQLPPGPHNFLGSNATWELFVNTAARLGGRQTGRDWQIDAFAKGTSFSDVRRVLAQRVAPGALDRVRMERISAHLLPQSMADELGRRLLLLRGRGGTGKTMALLQMAWHAYRDSGDRCLVLTYNRVLAADLRRLLALLRVPDDVARESIQVRTIVGYMSRLLRHLGFSVESEDFDSSYARAKSGALEYLDQGALTESDLDRLRSDEANEYGFDLVFVDEGQDWPNDEIRLLGALFPRSVMTVADGVDQFVRAGRPDWRKGLTRAGYTTVRLARSLRMKGGLTRFANRVALALDLDDWYLEPSGELAGGRIEIVVGDFLDSGSLDSLLNDSTAAGNAPIDSLFCVPPSDAYTCDDGGRRSRTGDRLESAGHEIWNAVSPSERIAYPCSADVLRVVQYESSRGAEGWLVVALKFDLFCDQKAATWSTTPDGSLSDPHQARRLFLARWIMIAISRALDTLVIELTDERHWVSRLLLQV